MKVTDKSTWEDVKEKFPYGKLKSNLETDVAIVGGGITGILSAYLLAKAGKKVAILESSKLISSTTAYTTAFITQSIDTDLVDMLKIYGKQNSKLVLDSHGQAIDLIESIIKEERIDCEFMRCSNYSYANVPEDFEYLEEEKEAADALDFPIVLKKKNDLNFNNAGYLEIKRQAKFHPLKFLQGLIPKLQELGVLIYQDTEVTKISGNKKLTVNTKAGSIVKSEYVIVATYDPFNKPKNTFAKKGMYKSYVFEVQIPEGILKEGIYEDMENPYHYFRVDRMNGFDRMIVGGEDHRRELKVPENKNFMALEQYLEKLLEGKKYTIVKKWAGPILEPSDGLALMGEYAPKQLIATAFSGNGMTYSAISAMIFRDIITGKKNSWVKIYDPKRRPTAKQLLIKARDYGEEFYQGAVKNMFK
jgi:glycine/D-amino acid oxidase-like deaminating enzyme